MKDILKRQISHKCSGKLLLKSWAFHILGTDKTRLSIVIHFLKRTQVPLLLLRKKKRANCSSLKKKSFSFPPFSWNCQERKCLLSSPLLSNTVAWLEFQETLKTLAENPVSHKHVWISRWQSKNISPIGEKIYTLMKKELTHSSNETANFFFLIRVMNYKSSAKGENFKMAIAFLSIGS